jgi:hypothetical protein
MIKEPIASLFHVVSKICPSSLTMHTRLPPEIPHLTCAASLRSLILQPHYFLFSKHTLSAEGLLLLLLEIHWLLPS